MSNDSNGRQSAAECLHAQGADDSPAEPLTAEEIARAMDAVNFTLVAFGVPDKFRAFIDALLGASGGSADWFEAADIEIGQRARQVSAEGLKQKTIEKWTQWYPA